MSPTATRPPASRRAAADRTSRAGARSGSRAGARGARIDPRISARRTAVVRQQGRRRLRVLIGLAAGTGLIVGIWFLLHSPVFAARVVTVVGATHETPAQVEFAAGLSNHPPLLDINAGRAAGAIERLPWVQTAVVKVSWPDGVRITLTERTPSLAMRTATGTWAELSTDGRVLSVVAAAPPGLVVVTGPVAPGVPGSAVPVGDNVGLKVASTLPASFRSQVTGVHVEPGGWVQLTMTTPIVVDIGTATQLEAKYEDVSSILAGATLQAGDVIDVSVPDAPTVTGG